jgi:hypothetical protein
VCQLNYSLFHSLYLSLHSKAITACMVPTVHLLHHECRFLLVQI